MHGIMALMWLLGPVLTSATAGVTARAGKGTDILLIRTTAAIVLRSCTISMYIAMNISADGAVEA